MEGTLKTARAQLTVDQCHKLQMSEKEQIWLPYELH